MTRVKRKLIATFLAVFTAFSLASCVGQKDVDKAVKPVSESVARLEKAVEDLEAKNAALDEAKKGLEEKLAALENRIDCLEGKHELVEIKANGDGTHTGECKHCEQSFTPACVYGDPTEGEDGVKRKTCSACGDTVEVRENVTIALKAGASLSVYWDSAEAFDLSTLLEISEGAGAATYTLDSSTVTDGSIEGSVLKYKLQGDYTITVTTAQTATHNAGSFTFTLSIVANPATGEFDGDWITL